VAKALRPSQPTINFVEYTLSVSANDGPRNYLHELKTSLIEQHTQTVFAKAREVVRRQIPTFSLKIQHISIRIGNRKKQPSSEGQEFPYPK
jgi:hypothetical protein